MPISFSGSGTKDDPIRITGVSTNLEAVEAEYTYVTDRFGKQNKDWKLLLQVLIPMPEGQFLDQLTVVLADGKEVEIYFEVTEYIGKF